MRAPINDDRTPSTPLNLRLTRGITSLYSRLSLAVICVVLPVSLGVAQASGEEKLSANAQLSSDFPINEAVEIKAYPVGAAAVPDEMAVMDHETTHAPPVFAERNLPGRELSPSAHATMIEQIGRQADTDEERAQAPNAARQKRRKFVVRRSTAPQLTSRQSRAQSTRAATKAWRRTLWGNP